MDVFDQLQERLPLGLIHTLVRHFGSRRGFAC